MHSANFTAFSCLVSFLSAPLVAVLVVPLPAAAPVPEVAFEPQPALTRPTSATTAKAAGARSVLFMVAPRVCGNLVDITAASPLHPWIVGWVGVHGRSAVIDGVGAALEVPRLVGVDLAEPVTGAVLGQPCGGTRGPDVDCVPRHVRRRLGTGHPAGCGVFRAVLRNRLTQ